MPHQVSPGVSFLLYHICEDELFFENTLYDNLFWVDYYYKLKQREEIDESSLNINRILLSHFWTKD
jgi:hypothetical protein